jgi:hypothetical protein
MSRTGGGIKKHKKEVEEVEDRDASVNGGRTENQ